MTKVDSFRLRKMIPREEFDYTLLTAALQDYSGVRQKINELLKAGVITRVKKGLYVFGPDYNQGPVCKETLANLISGPSCISMEYALSYYGLIPERVETITCVTPKRDKEFETPLGHFSYRYLGIEKYPHGIDQVWIDQMHPVLMASPEKALADYIYSRDIPKFSNSDDARDFLELDLRLDTKHFDVDKILKLNGFYRDPNIKLIAEIL